MKHLASILLISSLIACGGGDDDDDDDDVITADAAPQIDSGPQPDATPAVCYAQADYGDLTLANVVAEWQDGTAQMPEFMEIQGDANADAQPDLFVLEVYKGFGVFETGEIVPGTYEITGAELNYATCGVCVRLFTDFDGTDVTDAGYIATGGTVTITSVSPSFVGSVDNITYQHVNIADMTFQSTPHPDGCMSALTTTSWDVIPVDASM